MSDAQAAALLAYVEPERESAPAHWWIPRLMLASGLRLEEAAKLRACDVQEVEGAWVFNVNEEVGRLKTPQSARLVPVHSAILSALLAQRAKVEREVGPEGNLWGLEADAEGRWSEQLSKRLNLRLRRAGVTDKRVVMESARNRFADELRYADVDEATAADLMGHKAGDLMTFGRYAKRARLEKLVAAVEKVPGSRR